MSIVYIPILSNLSVVYSFVRSFAGSFVHFSFVAVGFATKLLFLLCSFLFVLFAFRRPALFLLFFSIITRFFTLNRQSFDSVKLRFYCIHNYAPRYILFECSVSRLQCFCLLILLRQSVGFFPLPFVIYSQFHLFICMREFGSFISSSMPYVTGQNQPAK